MDEDEAEDHAALKDQEHNEDLEALDDQKKQDWQLATTEDQKDLGRAHLTIKKDSASEKMKITFEAHQLVIIFSTLMRTPLDMWARGCS